MRRRYRGRRSLAVDEIRVLVGAVARIVVLSSQLCGGGGWHSQTPDPHVRAGDRHLASLIADAARGSPTIQLLIARLEESDTVVYVEPSRNLGNGRTGELAFMTSS